MMGKGCRRFFLVLGLFMLSTCVPSNQRNISLNKGSTDNRLSRENHQKSAENGTTPSPDPKGKERATEVNPNGRPPVKSLKNGEVLTKKEGKNLTEGDPAVHGPGSTYSENGDHSDECNVQPPNNQELIDSALEFCQVATDFWEQGDLDNALDALDKAYSLILKVTTDGEPEVLQQKEDLRFTVSKRIIEVYASRFTVVNGYHNAIPLEMNRHVRRALELFQTTEKKFFIDAYRRSGKYRPEIVRQLKAAGLPEELSWLPLIESGFKISP